MASPLLLFVATPAEGHFFPLRAIAKELHSRGYDCTILASEAFRSRVEETGVHFIAHKGDADHVVGFDLSNFPKDGDVSDPLQMGAYITTHCFVRPIPAQSFDLQQVLKSFQKEYPERPVAIFTEVGFLGVLPMLAGAPGLRAPVITMGVAPLMLTGIDSVSFGGQGEIPDFTPESRERIKGANTFIREVFLKGSIATYHAMMKDHGAVKRTPTFFFDDSVTMPDRFLQMCIPSAEFPRSDMPEQVSFVGGMPTGYRDAWHNPPVWWPEVRANKEKKRIVFVSQGTSFTDPTDLLIPTIHVLAGAPNTVVVAALGIKGSAPPADLKIPANCYVADFVPYDDILQVADVFIMNSGYGGWQHGLQHGVPMVLAGEGADKPEVGARAEWAGSAINLRKQRPSEEQIREAVEKVFSDPKYKERALELQAEAKSYHIFDLIEKTIPEVAAKVTEQ